MKPVVFAVLPNKDESMYSTSLNESVSYAQRTVIFLARRWILIDFEMAEFKMLSDTFPAACIEGS